MTRGSEVGPWTSEAVSVALIAPRPIGSDAVASNAAVPVVGTVPPLLSDRAVTLLAPDWKFTASRCHSPGGQVTPVTLPPSTVFASRTSRTRILLPSFCATPR